MTTRTLLFVSSFALGTLGPDVARAARQPASPEESPTTPAPVVPSEMQRSDERAPPPQAVDSERPSPSLRPSRPSPVGSVATAAAAVGPAATGFAIEASFTHSNTLVDSTLTLPSFTSSFLVGFRHGGLVAGLGLELGRVSVSVGDESRAQTSYLLRPGVRFTLARASDGRAELFGQIDAGFGEVANTDSDSGRKTGNDISRFSFDLGLGARYFPHPNFGLGAAALFRRDSFAISSGGPTSTMAISGLGAAFSVLGVF